MLRLGIGLLFVGLSSICWAKKNLPVPRFVSTRASEVNLRVGPGAKYPIDWQLIRSNIPLEVTAEFDTWRRVHDWEGTEGWVHQSMLSGRRHGVIKVAEAILKKSDRPTSKSLVKLEQGLIVHVKKCRNNWCIVKTQGYEGWLPADNIWGVYKDEKVG